MDRDTSKKDTFIIGLMLFALFLGAGNMIFPPALGQAAGTNMLSATLGFLITGVGLPLLGITAIALSGGDLEKLGSRLHPIFGVIFSGIVYLAIGPFFGIPRTGTVAFEIGMTPFLPDGATSSDWPLFVFSLFFFGLTFLLSLNPSKLVDRVGKILTPTLIVILVVLIAKAIISPMGAVGEPIEAYQNSPFFKGFIEGYLTMDTIAALAFGIVIVHAVKQAGVTNSRKIAGMTIKAGVIAATGLASVYLGLSYFGATSYAAIGTQENGAAILARATHYLFGSLGAVILGLAITFACLTTAVGLVSATAEYFSNRFPNFSYRLLVSVITLFSLTLANFGLSQLIAISLPVLLSIYPIAIALILLSFMDRVVNGAQEVYITALIFTGFVSIVDGLAYSGIKAGTLIALFEQYLPLYAEGVGWIVPFILGTLLGYLIGWLRGNIILSKADYPSS